MESIRTGEASALVNVIKADFFSTEQKIRRVNFLYHDEGNSPVEFLISSRIGSALIRIPAAGT